MMLTVPEIRDIKEYLVNDVHGQRLAQQVIDLTYHNDTFSLPLIKNDKYIIRLGQAAALTNNAAAQIITNNPQVFVKSLRDIKTANEGAARIAKETNRWARNGLKQSQQIYHEFVKNDVALGEAWIHTYHNPILVDWDEELMGGKWQDIMPDIFPIKFSVTNPMIVFSDPREEEDGITHRLVISYERAVGDILSRYPMWTGHHGRTLYDRMKFFMYIDDHIRYVECDGEPMLRDGNGEICNGEGIQENVYHFVPFSHAYSGFGMSSADGDPVNLAVSRIRNLRDKYKEDTTMRSDLYFGTHKFAHKHIDIINRSGTPLGEDAFKEYDAGAGKINEINIPEGAEWKVADSLVPDRQVFDYAQSVHAEVANEEPPTLRGFPSGTSGRQEDILGQRGSRLYDTIVYGTSEAFSAAFLQGVRILKEMPFLKPSSIKSADLNYVYEINVELKAESPIDADRLSMAGRAMHSAGQISLKYNLINFQGMTEEGADDVIDEMWAEKYMLESPEIAELMMQRAAEKSGMLADIQALREKRRQLEQAPKELKLGNQIGTQGGEPRIENIQTAEGFEMAQSRTQGGIRSTG